MPTVVLGAPAMFARAVADGLGAPLLDNDELALPGGTTGVVITVGADLASEPSTVATLEDTDWRRLTEIPMKRALDSLQRSRSVLSSRGGRIVLITPTIGLAGAPHLVPYTTAVEGIRAMTKSAARQWISDGIWINMIAAPLHLFAPELRGSANHLTAAAVSEDDILTANVVETAEFLLRHDLRHLVGATVVIDGGTVMLP